MVFTGSSRWRPLSGVVQKRAARLQTAKGRTATGLFLLEGFRLLTAALEARWPLDAIIVREDDETRWRLARLLQEHRLTEVNVYTAAPKTIQSIADTVEPSGIIALARHKILTPAEQEVPGKRLLIVDNVRDPGNLGAILRSAAAFGVDAVYLSRGTVNVYNPKVVRASMGTLFMLPIISNAVLSEISGNLRRQRFTVFVADPHTGRTPKQIGKPARWALVIGGETEGLSDLWRTCGAKPLRIPLAPGVESLNSAVAAGILLYQLATVRGTSSRTMTAARKPRRRERQIG